MTAREPQADSWLKSRNLPRLAFAVVFSAPVAGVILALVLGFTVMRNIIFMVPHPEIDSEFVQADFGQILVNTVKVAVGGLMVGGLLGWPVMLAIGLPMHAVLIRKTPAKAWHYAVAGLAAGLLAGLLRYAMERGGAGTNDLIILLAIGGVAGAVASLMFWFIRRPDKDAAEYKT
jgi:LytS/YehU family sensor histidine kinase